MSLTRQRAARLAHRQNTNRQAQRPEIGQKSAYKATRAGVAEHFPAPAGQTSMEVALALLGYDEPLRRALEWPSVKAAQPHAAPTLSLLQTVPGIGKLLLLVLLEERHTRPRFRRGQDVVSSCRLVKGAKTAAVLWLRDDPTSQKS